MNGYNDDQNQYNNGYQPDDRYRLEQERQFRIEDDRLRRTLAEIDQKSSFECSLNVAAQWNFETNVNEITQVEAVSIHFHKKFPNVDVADTFLLHQTFCGEVNAIFPSLNISYVNCEALQSDSCFNFQSASIFDLTSITLTQNEISFL